MGEQSVIAEWQEYTAVCQWQDDGGPGPDPICPADFGEDTRNAAKKAPLEREWAIDEPVARGSGQRGARRMLVIEDEWPLGRNRH